jgi:hypothetical protein
VRSLVLAAIVTVAACKRPSANPDAWPALPKSNEDVRHLVASTGKRPTAESDASLPNAAEHASVITDVKTPGVASGFDAIDAVIARWLAAAPEKNAVVAFGSSHDSRAQIDAFRRVVGPRARITWTRIMMEQLHADGHWATVDADAQKGDDAALERYGKSGAREDLDAVLDGVQRDTYTAGKYGSVDVIGDLLAEARAAGRPVSGCDMAPALRARVTSIDERSLHSLRELHCVHAMRDATKKDAGPHRVAVLWGRNHVASDRFPRLVPPEWSSFVVSLLDAPADDEVVLVDPVLTPSGRLVLASPNGAKHFERKRTKGSATRSRFAATTRRSASEPMAWIDGKRFDGEPTTIPPGHHLLAVDDGKRTIAAAIEIPPHGAIEVQLDDGAPEVTATIVEP